MVEDVKDDDLDERESVSSGGELGAASSDIFMAAAVIEAVRERVYGRRLGIAMGPAAASRRSRFNDCLLDTLSNGVTGDRQP